MCAIVLPGAVLYLFFFSSRGRHTRCSRDWSSDVCSSDLSPASCAGTRAQLLLKSQTSPLTARLANGGAPLGEVFTFMSSLYFRGKLAYAMRFGRPFVIAPGRGLLPADVLIRVDDLRKMATVPVDEAEPAFRDPLVRDATALHPGLR